MGLTQSLRGGEPELGVLSEKLPDEVLGLL